MSVDLVRDIVCRTLKIDPASCDPHRSLATYGLDSLTAVQLVADLEDALGRRLPEWLLSEHATLAALLVALCGEGGAEEDELMLMQADSRLAGDIHPASHAQSGDAPRHVLLTGATGFLGAWLLQAILEDPEIRVTCLVRSAGRDPVERVRQNLDRYGLWRQDRAARLNVVSGDLALPALGLDRDRYAALALDIDSVFHAGADVNWVLPYRGLRDVNVRGTSELLRFACSARSKAFHFVSSLSVCYATDGPPVVSECDDMLPHLAALPLGYARSKCVAEALVRQARARGLQARIYRPALLAGDAHTGASNTDDLIASLLNGCVNMGAAPDLDWAFDAVPVDYTARAIVALSRAEGHELETIHLAHPRPRHWRECVLWARFRGYQIRLTPFAGWRDDLECGDKPAGQALYRLRSFFSRRIDGRRSVAELYQEHTRSVVADNRSRAVLNNLGFSCPSLTTDLLDRYFDDYVARGVLAATPASDCPRPSMTGHDRVRGRVPRIESILARLIRAHFGDADVEVRDAELISTGSDRSIIGELMSWRHGPHVGLFHYRLGLQGATSPGSLDVMVKVKTADEHVLEVGETIADLCDERLAHQMRRFRDFIGIRGSHHRELAIYEQADERLKRHMPACYGTWRHDGSWGLVLEHLQDMAVLDASDDLASWTTHHIAAAIDGLAAMHSVWLGRERELCAQPWIGHVPTKVTADRMTPLWQALAAHAAPRFLQCAGRELVETHERLVSSVSHWWPALERSPLTLLHNDFNSRNVGLRQTAGGPQLVAYDWELSTVGAPQRDLAEFLCFVLPDHVSGEALTAWIERHRDGLQQESGRVLSPDSWRAGFDSALADLLVNRLSFYALVDRVKPQPFLPRILRTWQRLFEYATTLTRDASRGSSRAHKVRHVGPEMTVVAAAR